MKYNGKSKEEYIKELKKKYGELLEPELFNDDIYIKIEEGRQAYERGDYYTIEQVKEMMKKEFETIKKDKRFQNKIIIAEEDEVYNDGI